MTHTRIRDKDSDRGWPNAVSSFGLQLTSVSVQYNPASTWKEQAHTQIWSNTVQRLISSVVFWIQMCLLLSHNAPQTFTFHGHFPFWSCEKRGHVFFAIWRNKPSAWMHSWDQMAHLNHILNFLCVCVRVRVHVRVRVRVCVCLSEEVTPMNSSLCVKCIFKENYLLSSWYLTTFKGAACSRRKDRDLLSKLNNH